MCACIFSVAVGGDSLTALSRMLRPVSGRDTEAFNLVVMPNARIRAGQWNVYLRKRKNGCNGSSADSMPVSKVRCSRSRAFQRHQQWCHNPPSTRGSCQGREEPMPSLLAAARLRGYEGPSRRSELQSARLAQVLQLLYLQEVLVVVDSSSPQRLKDVVAAIHHCSGRVDHH